MVDVLPMLHIYPQTYHHTEAMVVGNRQGLLALREAIDRALEGEGEQKVARVSQDVFVMDGEGYTAWVVRQDQDWQSPAWLDLAMPYTGDYCKTPDDADDVIWPSMIIKAALDRGEVTMRD